MSSEAGEMESAPAEPTAEPSNGEAGPNGAQVVPDVQHPPADQAPAEATEAGGGEAGGEAGAGEGGEGAEAAAEAIEITVPAELMPEDECKLCEVKFLNPDMASQHYGGKKHAAKENAYIRKVYEDKGIDPTRFLVNPEAKAKSLAEFSYAPNESVGTPVEEAKNPADLDKYHFSCFLCGLHFELYDDVEKHVKTPTHAVRIWEYQQTGSEDYRYHGSARLRNLAEEWPEDFRCKICDKELNSPAQYEQHILSKNHLRKERVLAEGGDPRQATGDRSAWAGPPAWGPQGPSGFLSGIQASLMTGYYGWEGGGGGWNGGPPRGGGEWRGRGRGGYAPPGAAGGWRGGGRGGWNGGGPQAAYGQQW